MVKGDRGYGGGGGGGSGVNRSGGRAGKGPKPQFTRVIPKFLQSYKAMLTGSQTGRGADGGVEEEVFSGGEGAVGASSSGMSGKIPRGSMTEAMGAGSSGGSGGGAFDDYDEEEVAELEEYLKAHPSKAEDREALRQRAKELSASINMSKKPAPESSAIDISGVERITDASALRRGDMAGGARASSSTMPGEAKREYTDASGKLKFNKRMPVDASGGTATQAAGSETGKREKKKARLGKLAKANTKLLSFGDDEDE